MKIIDALKTSVGLSAARKREREIASLITRLLEMKDEATLLEGLADLGVTPEHPRYGEILKIWREAQ